MSLALTTTHENTAIFRGVSARILLANSKVLKYVYPICPLERQNSLGN
jgi:hypothetical protein